MSFGQPCDEFPLSSLPPLIRDAVIEAQQITQAPLGLVAASALGAVSLVCQNLIDVCRLNTLRGPVSLFFLTLAESGERKTAVDKLLMKPLYQQEMQLYSRYKSELAVWKNKEELLKAQKKALLSKLNKELRKGADESETLRQLEVLQKNSAEEPVRYKFIFMMPRLRQLRISFVVNGVQWVLCQMKPVLYLMDIPCLSCLLLTKCGMALYCLWTERMNPNR